MSQGKRCRFAVLHLQHTSDHRARRLAYRLLGPRPRFPTQSACEGAQEFAFLSFQLMHVLLVWGPHFGNQFWAPSLQTSTRQSLPYLSPLYGFLLSAGQSPGSLARPASSPDSLLTLGPALHARKLTCADDVHWCCARCLSGRLTEDWRVRRQRRHGMFPRPSFLPGLAAFPHLRS